MTTMKKLPSKPQANTEKAMTTKSINLELESRVGRLEGAFETLARDVSVVADNIIELQRGFSGFKDSVQSYIGTATAPKWPTIAAFISLVLTLIVMAGTLVGFIFSGQGDIISSNTLESRKNAAAVFDLKYDLGKLEQYQSSHMIESQTGFRRIEELEKKLANDDTDVTVASLSSRLLDLQIHISKVNQQLNNIENWRLTISNENGKTNSITERLTKEMDLLSASTTANRWTKEDHQHYESLVSEELHQLRTGLDSIQHELISIQATKACPHAKE